MAKGKGRSVEPESPNDFDRELADDYQEGDEEVEQGADVAMHDDSDYVNYAANGDDDYVMNGTGIDDAEELEQSIEVDDQVIDEAFNITPVPATKSVPAAANANGRKKRKSDSIEEEEATGSDAPPMPSRKARTSTDRKLKAASTAGQASTVYRDPPSESNIDPALRTKRPGRPPGRPAGKKAAPERQDGELGQLIEKVKARPGQQKSLYILRRETPADDSATHTRSGRVSVKPLAYWRNERCVYGGSPGGPSLADGARFPLNSIKEIIRTEEVEKGRSSSKGKRRGKKGKGGRRKATEDGEVDRSGSDSDSDSDDNDMIDPNAEPWESSTGIFRGQVSMWDSITQTPLDESLETDLAYAPASIETREVKSSHPDMRSFKYAKLLSTSFFGAGIVDLAPGDVKRTKNARRMQMCVFGAKGRVTVEVAAPGAVGNRFSLGKGGFWQVPRGQSHPHLLANVTSRFWRESSWGYGASYMNRADMNF